MLREMIHGVIRSRKNSEEAEQLRNLQHGLIA
jgi:hypothetical protein